MQSSTSQIAARVEKRIAVTLLFLILDKLTLEIPTRSATEDIAIALGKAFKSALADKKGIERYADTCLPMDECLILSAADISGRGVLRYTVNIPAQKVGDFDTELCEEFWQGFVREAGIALHIRLLDGTNSHHIIEGIFKSVARTLRKAVSVDSKFSDEIPSTKGVL